MQRYYRVELCDLWRGRLSLRRLAVLIEALPATSRFARIYAGVDAQLFDLWSLTDLLLARTHDEIAALRWQWESAHLGKSQRPRKQPQPLTPPLDDQQRDADVIPLVSPHRLGGFINEHDDDDAPERRTHGD